MVALRHSTCSARRYTTKSLFPYPSQISKEAKGFGRPTDQHPPKGGWTFRVRGVPHDWDRGSLQSFLAEQDDSANPAVRSLANEIHGRSQTATVSFQGTPRQLRIPLPPHPTGPTEPTEPQVLILDDKFLGVTTLYTPPPEDHKVEYVSYLRFQVRYSSSLALLRFPVLADMRSDRSRRRRESTCGYGMHSRTISPARMATNPSHV